MKRTIFIVSAVLLANVSVCGAEGMGTLIEISKSQAEIKKQYEEETRNFEKIKNGIESGEIKKGQSKVQIQSRYGEPVVSVKDSDGVREDCIYKPETSDFFKGIRATLIYSQQGVLEDARVEEIK